MFWKISSIIFNTKRVVRATILLVLLSSCSTLQVRKHELFKMEIPKFQGSLNPISGPLELKYHPASISFDVLTIEEAELFDTDICRLFFIGQPASEAACERHVKKYGDASENAREERNVIGEIDISQLGEDLVWQMKSFKMTADGQQFKPLFPIENVRLVSNCRGRISEVKIFSPTFEQNGILKSFRPGTKRFSESVRLFRDSILPFPKKAILAGDVLFSFGLSGMLVKMLASWVEQDEQIILNHIEDADENVSYIVRGWRDINNRKVLVSDLHINRNVKIRGEKMNVTIGGFILVDAESGHIMVRQHLSHMKYGKSQFLVHYKNVSQIHPGG